MEDARAVPAKRRVIRLAKDGRLTELRQASGLSQSDVARGLGVSPSAVSRWEAGKSRPKAAHALALLTLLGSEG
jgi:transcriptional regulator with XRE-family HTH domain